MTTVMHSPTSLSDYKEYLVDDDKIYISSVTFELKRAGKQQQNDKQTSNFLETYEWHTQVLTSTPPSTPIPPQATPEAIVEENLQKVQQDNKQTSSKPSEYNRGKDLFTPSMSFNEPDNIQTVLNKFMSTERYHSQMNGIMNHSVISNVGGTKNSTKV